MKKKIWLVLIVLLVSVFALAACNSASSNKDLSNSAPGNYEDANNDNGGELTEAEEGDPNVYERKIIYKADAQLYTDNLKETIAVIKGAVNKADGEWFDNESISEKNAYFTVRVKSENLDEFLDKVSESGTVRNLNKSASDISLQYHDIELRIESLETEYERLTELKSRASFNELFQIEQRQSQIRYELNRMQGSLNKYDSLIEYSEVTLSIYEQSPPPDSVPFGTRLNKVFKGAWNALRTFLEWLLIIVTAIFPFAVVFVPIGVGVAILVIYLKKHKGKSILFRRKSGDAKDKKDNTPSDKNADSNK